MKTILFLITLVSAQAREISFVWNKPTTPVDGHTIYTKVADGNWVNVGEVKSGEEFSGSFPDGEFQITITAFRQVGELDRLKSERSEPLTVPPAVDVPTGLRIRVLVEVQTK